jgi:ATP-dependent Clp protease ATP-binding subunit ClpA
VDRIGHENAQGERENYCTRRRIAPRVVGQEEAIEAVSDAVRRSSAGLDMKTRELLFWEQQW